MEQWEIDLRKEWKEKYPENVILKIQLEHSPGVPGGFFYTNSDSYLEDTIIGRKFNDEMWKRFLFPKLSKD